MYFILTKGGMSALGVIIGSSIILNSLVDEILVEMDKELAESGLDEVTIPLSTNFQYKNSWLNIVGKFSCDQFKIGNISTIERTGDVVLSSDGSNTSLSVQMGLGILEFGSDSCQITIKKMGTVTSSVKGSVDTNSVDMELTITRADGTCVVTLNHLTTHLDGIRITTGGGKFHSMLDKIIDLIIEQFNDQIVTQINKVVYSAANKKIQEADLCSKIPT